MCNKDTLLLIFVVVIIIFVVAGFIFVNHNNKKVRENFQTTSISEEESEPTLPTLDKIIDCINTDGYHYNLIQPINGINEYKCINQKSNPVYFASNVLKIKDNTVKTNDLKEDLNTMEVFDEDFKSILKDTLLDNEFSLLTLPNNIKNNNQNWSIQIFTVSNSKLENADICGTSIKFNNNQFNVVQANNDSPTPFIILANDGNVAGGGATGTMAAAPTTTGGGATGIIPTEPTTTGGGATGTKPSETTATGGATGTMSTGGATGTKPSETTATGGATGTKPSETTATGGATGTMASGTMAAAPTTTGEPFLGNMILEPFSNGGKTTGVQGVTPDIGGSPF